ncbi:MAG: hypothetical protein ACTHXT_14690 [Sphingobacterium sp.]
MQFVCLTHKVLRSLKDQGYTVLLSASKLTDENPTWVPDNIPIDDLMDLGSELIAKLSIPLEEGNLLVIEDALKNIDEENLIGQVFIENS